MAAYSVGSPPPGRRWASAPRPLMGLQSRVRQSGAGWGCAVPAGAYLVFRLTLRLAARSNPGPASQHGR